MIGGCAQAFVKRGANCDTDHQFLCASVRMAWQGLKKIAGMNEGKRYDVSGLVSCKDSDNMSTGRPLMQQYIEEILERATYAWPEEVTVEERWEVMHSAMNQWMSCLVMRKTNNQTDSKSQRISLGLSYSGGIKHMTDGWLQERKRI